MTAPATPHGTQDAAIEAAKESARTGAGNIATPTGLQPVSTVAGSKEEAKKIFKDRVKQLEAEAAPRAHQEFREDQVEKMGKADLRAVAEARGYELRRGGENFTRREFLRLQGEDENLDPPQPKASKGKAKS
jgi:hypothetical protein